MPSRAIRCLSVPTLLAASAAVLVPGCSSSQPAFQSARPQGTAQPPAQTAAAPAAPSHNGVQRPFDPFDDSFTAAVWPSNAAPVPGTIPDAPLNLFGELGGPATARSFDPARAAGANLTQVSFSTEGADFDPDASRDGRFVVYASTQHHATPDLYVKTVDSHVVTQITSDPASDVMPKISPDGTRIAFASDRGGNWDVYVTPIDGGKAVQITSSPSDDLHPSWSPDGSKLVFCRLGEVSGQWEMWVTEVLNPGIAHFIGYGLFPEWCPVAGTGADGTDRIVFQRSRERGSRAFGVWTVDYRDGQAGRPTELASSSIAACINPTWSPDGQWVVFSTVPLVPGQLADARPSVADLWMIDLNGTSRVHLTTDRALNLMPTWSASGRLFFVSDRGGVDNIWSMDTTGPVELARGQLRDTHHAPASNPYATVTDDQH